MKKKIFLFVGIISLLFAGGAGIAATAHADPEHDEPVLQRGLQRASEELSERMDEKTAAATAASLLLLGREEEFHAGQLLVVSVAASAAVTGGLKWVVNRRRPTPPTVRKNASFPSGHATAAFAAAAVIGHSYPRLAVPAYFFAGSVSYARLYLRRHYPTDIVAGALIGIAAARLAVKYQDRFTLSGRGMIGALIGDDGTYACVTINF